MARAHYGTWGMDDCVRYAAHDLDTGRACFYNQGW